MIELIIFILGSIGFILVSIPSLRKPGSYGFYRFFAWEVILGLLMVNVRKWFDNPFAWYQIVSWIILCISLIPLFSGIILLRKKGKPTNELEGTTELVTGGVFRFIRHPMYASLLYLAWGLFFKSPSMPDGCLVIAATAYLYGTARSDERESIGKFGMQYLEYMKKTKLFIPFIW